MITQTGETRVAVLLPALDEAAAIEQVVNEFKTVLPKATVYVYDNKSSDDTAILAARAGATVGVESNRGKGNVVRRMFSDIEADIFIVADADGTYDIAAAPSMVRNLIDENLDMVVGARVSEEPAAYRPGHVFGNRILSWSVAYLFKSGFADVLSGYRVLSRRFVKSFPLLSQGFEIEVMLTIHALELGLPSCEVPTAYRARVEGTASKLRTVRDGIKILSVILLLFKETKPFMLFGIGAAIFASLSLVLGLPVLFEFMNTGLVLRFPTAILASGIAVLSAISLTVGLILDTVSRGRREQKRLAYLAIPSVLGNGIVVSDDIPPAPKA